jgi:hypothetical protein
MKTALLALALVVLVPFAVRADNTLVSFKGGIGVDPVSGIFAGTPPPPDGGPRSLTSFAV